ncbi:MAG: hypothetical protein KGK17_00975 [Betaproteobacteria bacterium]|nr:hypothetical protein [Betaproteobacteria bacterium]
MTREGLELAKAYYSQLSLPWVQVPRELLLDGIVSLEAAWNERDEYKQHLASMLMESAVPPISKSSQADPS